MKRPSIQAVRLLTAATLCFTGCGKMGPLGGAGSGVSDGSARSSMSGDERLTDEAQADPAGEGGILGSTTESPQIQEGDYVARVIGWEGVGLPPWRSFEEFLSELHAGTIDDKLIQGAQVQYWLPGIFIVIRKDDDPDHVMRRFVCNSLWNKTAPHEPGFYLLFARRVGEEHDLDVKIKGFDTLEDLKNVVNDPHATFACEKQVAVALQQKVSIPPDPDLDSLKTPSLSPGAAQSLQEALGH